MRPKPLLVVSALLALLFGLGLTFAPDAMMQGFGVRPSAGAYVLSRDLGIVLLAVAVMDWMARDATPGPALDAILVGNLLVQVLQTVFDAYHVATDQISGAAVGGIVLHVALAVAFALAIFRPTKALP